MTESETQIEAEYECYVCDMGIGTDERHFNSTVEAVNFDEEPTVVRMHFDCAGASDS